MKRVISPLLTGGPALCSICACIKMLCFCFLRYWMQLVISAKIPMRISAMVDVC